MAGSSCGWCCAKTILWDSKPGCDSLFHIYYGPEFISKDLDRWAYWNHIELDFSRPGKPTDNALIEAFNSRFRQECLNEHWFMSLTDAQDKIEAWRHDYNHDRPHSALGYQSPAEFVAESKHREVEVA